MNSKHPRIIIVGAGIVGSSLAYHLVRRNARVTVIDKALNPANSVTAKSFAWITVAHNAPEAYLSLRQQAIADWHRIEKELGCRLNINWCGALIWHRNLADTERIVHQIINLGYDARLIDRQEIRNLETNLKIVPQQAMFAPNEGAVDPVLTTGLLLKAAHEAGADIQFGNEVLSLIANGARVTGVVTAKGILTADVIVVAAGTKAAALCQPLGLTLPVNISPAILMRFQHQHPFVNRIVSNPLMEIRAASDTLTLAAEDYIDESAENNPQAIAQRTLENIENHWKGTGHMRLIDVVAGRRPIPQDGLPVIGRPSHIAGLYLSVMHAGITLAAVAGRLAAAEILNEQDDILLSSYRLQRFV